MGTDNRVSVLRVNFGDSFDFFRIFLFFFCGCWYYRRCRLLLKFIYVRIGIINFEDKILDLFLKKFNDRVALGNYRITFIDLVFPVLNSLILGSNDPILLNCQSSKLVNLGDESVRLPKMTSRGMN
jgi:hypothetical protein